MLQFYCDGSPIRVGDDRLKGMQEFFRKFAHKTSEVVGSFWVFFIALIVIALWLMLGPVFGFSDTWQLAMNTLTNVIIFLTVFLIQNTQNRDAKTMELKLDELIRAQSKARNSLLELENLSDKELEALQKEFSDLYDKELKKRTKPSVRQLL